jgi:hypothetical protein
MALIDRSSIVAMIAGVVYYLKRTLILFFLDFLLLNSANECLMKDGVNN